MSITDRGASGFDGARGQDGVVVERCEGVVRKHPKPEEMGGVDTTKQISRFWEHPPRVGWGSIPAGSWQAVSPPPPPPSKLQSRRWSIGDRGVVRRAAFWAAGGTVKAEAHKG